MEIVVVVVDLLPMEGNDSKRRKICPHCTQNISYSAYLSHKARYYDNYSSQWTLVNEADPKADANLDQGYEQSDGEDEDAINQNDELDVEPESDSTTFYDDVELEDEDYETLEVAR